MNDLIKKLEDAECGSRELDAETTLHAMDLLDSFNVGQVVIQPDGWLCGPGVGEQPTKAPHYTTSLDATLTLVPEGWDWDVGTCEEGYTAATASVPKQGFRSVTYGNATSAVALCIAALKARQQYNG